MSDTSAPRRATGLKALFEPTRIGEMSRGGSVVVYALLTIPCKSTVPLQRHLEVARLFTFSHFCKRVEVFTNFFFVFVLQKKRNSRHFDRSFDFDNFIFLLLL